MEQPSNDERANSPIIDIAPGAFAVTLMQSMIGFDGRVSRKTFWLAMLVQFIVISLVFVPALHWLSGGQWLGDDWGKALRSSRIEALALMFAYVAILYPSVAVSARRLHDLDFSAQWSWLMYLPGVISILVNLAGLGGTRVDPSTLARMLDWPVYISGLVYLVGLGCVRGTNGVNRFGPDPLGRKAAPGSSTAVA